MCLLPFVGECFFYVGQNSYRTASRNPLSLLLLYLRMSCLSEGIEILRKEFVELTIFLVARIAS